MPDDDFERLLDALFPTRRDDYRAPSYAPVHQEN